jgi:hypothetical protein
MVLGVRSAQLTKHFEVFSREQHPEFRMPSVRPALVSYPESFAHWNMLFRKVAEWAAWLDRQLPQLVG